MNLKKLVPTDWKRFLIAGLFAVVAEIIFPSTLTIPVVFIPIYWYLGKREKNS